MAHLAMAVKWVPVDLTAENTLEIVSEQVLSDHCPCPNLVHPSSPESEVEEKRDRLSRRDEVQNNARDYGVLVSASCCLSISSATGIALMRGMPVTGSHSSRSTRRVTDAVARALSASAGRA